MPVEIPGMVAFLLTVLTYGFIYGLLTIGLNLHFGYTGLINFGHVAFFAAGAYTAALVTMPPPATVKTAVNYSFALGLPMPYGFVVSLVAAAATGGLLALFIGSMSVRLESHYLAIATFALAALFQTFIFNESWLTGGPFGLNEIPRPGYQALGPTLWSIVYLGIIVFITAGTLLFIHRVTGAPFGRVLKGIREDERASRMLGKETNKFKLKSFVLGGAIAGLAGALYAHYFGTIVPQQFLPLVTFFVWVSMLLGGAGSNLGAISGAILFIAFREFTRFLPEVPGYPLLMSNLRWVFIGLFLIALIRVRPEGIFGDPNEIVFEGAGSGEEE